MGGKSGGGGLAGSLAGGAVGSAIMGPVGAVPGALMGSGAASGLGDAWHQIIGGVGRAGQSVGMSGFDRPQGVPIQQATSIGDVQQAQQGAGNSLQSQQALLQALQGQNGLAQQNSIAGQQQGLANQLSAANGLATQQGAIQGLQGAAGMYGNIAQGKGPNPAQAMLNQSTGQNVANQAALMAGQRGAGANVGLMARQAAQQGANTQQQAVGQGATMQANQQLNALQGLTGTQQAIGGMGGQQLAAQQAQQQNMAAQANQVAGQQIGATTANTQANLTHQQQMQQALQGINNSNVAMQSNINSGNSALANTQMQGQQGILGGVMSGLGAAMGAHGGDVQHMALGGDPMVPAAPVIAQPVAPIAAPVAAPPPGPTSSFGKFLSGWNDNNAAETKGGGEDNIATSNMGNKALVQGGTDIGAGIKRMKNKKSPVPGGDMMAGPDSAGSASMMASKGGLAESGGHVKAQGPSQKAVAKGDSYSNDKVPAKLSEGEIVLPRSVTMSNNPIKDSAAFVEQVLAKRKGKAC